MVSIRVYIKLAAFLFILGFCGLTYMNCGPVAFSSHPPAAAHEGPAYCNGSGCNSNKQINSMGLVANHVRCAICHMNVVGDIAATSVAPFAMRDDSWGTIFGQVFVNQPIVNDTGVTNPDPNHILLQGDDGNDIRVYGSANRVAVDTSNPTNRIIIRDASDPAVFVPFKLSEITSGVLAGNGLVTQGGQTLVNQIQSGNVILDGSTNKIFVNGEVLITGDLVIKGHFSGIGTIYVSGNIYVPDDILVDGNDTLFNSYKQNQGSADTFAQQAITNKASALRLASQKSIFIGNMGTPDAAPSVSDLPSDSQLPNYLQSSYNSYYTGERIDGYLYDTSEPMSRLQFAAKYMDMQSDPDAGIGYDTSERKQVYTWKSDYLKLLKPEFELGTGSSTLVCGGKQFRVEIGSVARIDAALYAQDGVAGFIGAGGNLLINGGVITQNLALLGGTGRMLVLNKGDNLVDNTVWEFYKKCPTGSPQAGSVWQLPLTAVNPLNGLSLDSNEIRYDYRLRNQGAGFDIMRSDTY